MTRFVRRLRTLRLLTCVMVTAMLLAACSSSDRVRVEAELTQLSVDLRQTPDETMQQLADDPPDDLVVSYQGTEGDQLTATFARQTSDGTCLGFDVRIPAGWLTGTARLDIGQILEQNPDVCQQPS